MCWDHRVQDFSIKDHCCWSCALCRYHVCFGQTIANLQKEEKSTAIGNIYSLLNDVWILEGHAALYVFLGVVQALCLKYADETLVLVIVPISFVEPCCPYIDLALMLATGYAH